MNNIQYTDQKKTGRFIAQLRKNQGLTQQQLGDILGVTGKTVSRWENGNYMPDLSLIIPLAAALGVTTDELLAGAQAARKDKAEDKTGLTVNIPFITPQRLKIFAKRLLIVLLVLVLSALVIFDRFVFSTVDFDYKPIGMPKDIRDIISDNENYAMGERTTGMKVYLFRDPAAALRQVKEDCKEAIEFIKKTCHLPGLSRYTAGFYYMEMYKNNLYYKIQDEDVKQQCHKLMQVLSIYNGNTDYKLFLRLFYRDLYKEMPDFYYYSIPKRLYNRITKNYSNM